MLVTLAGTLEQERRKTRQPLWEQQQGKVVKVKVDLEGRLQSPQMVQTALRPQDVVLGSGEENNHPPRTLSPMGGGL